jgi:predicted TIM-barrel enzyme
MDSKGIINSVFGVPRALIGVIHVEALPGTPGSRRQVAQIAEAAALEARTFSAAGFHGLIIENTHDRPYLRGSVGPEVAAAAAVIGVEVRRAAALPMVSRFWRARIRRRWRWRTPAARASCA